MKSKDRDHNILLQSVFHVIYNIFQDGFFHAISRNFTASESLTASNFVPLYPRPFYYHFHDEPLVFGPDHALAGSVSNLQLPPDEDQSRIRLGLMAPTITLIPPSRSFPDLPYLS